ncbi:hypothetical protein IQ235_05590 [Oscillatoriales cyanobacterium LEGE 11467]|uniref:Uncharacterized protein n=1 Tax=Zarconia navalis LEGE 11467 TaxID=1828826 RepID=A0A928VTW1_9CYAN|nr:DUF6228 family protein [Zarconia navalis]MBE9040264.1 hypothetical protein [Zarconia navalis LEGE 11467]
MNKVTIKSANTSSKLEFSDVEHEYFTVAFSSFSMNASQPVWVYTGDYDRLTHLFLEMAENWQGWEGVKTWGATEDDFSLSCTSDKLGHISIAGTLVERNAPECWSASVKFNVKVEAGQLEQIAYEVRRLFAGM